LSSKTTFDNEIGGIPFEGLPPTTPNHVLSYFLAFMSIFS
jgi:hypothetical protein